MTKVGVFHEKNTNITNILAKINQSHVHLGKLYIVDG